VAIPSLKKGNNGAVFSGFVMPIVARYKIGLHGKDFIMKVGYSPKTKQFYVPLPNYMADLLGIDQVEAENQAKVERDFYKAVKEYNEKSAKTKKVIFYKFLSRIREYGVALDESDSAYESKGEMISHGVALDLWFLVGYVVKTPDDREEYFNEDKKRVGGGWAHRWKYMDYTEARDLFFREVRKMLAKQIEAMQDFFISNRDKVPELIDVGMTGRKFLPPPENP